MQISSSFSLHFPHQTPVSSRLARGVVAGVLMLLGGCLEISPDNLVQTAEGERLLSRCAAELPSRQAIRGEASLPRTFSLTSWNIQKTIQPGWQQGLDNRASQSDLLLIQEAVDKPALTEWLQQHQLRWQQVTAFRYEGVSMGVLTGARVPAVYSCAWKLPETAIRLPKSVLVNLYPVEGSQIPLLVINLHAINFELGMAAWRDEIRQLGRWAKRHRGPVIVAGDFNSWGTKRSALLVQEMQRANLREVAWQPEARSRVLGTPLDHIYYRGLQVESAVVTPTDASDHNPLQVRFSVP